MLRKIIVPLTFIALLLISSIVCASSQINSDSQIVKDGIKTAETYWNSQKKSDEVLFHSVTPHDSMEIVFDWSFVNRSDVLVEESPIKNIKSDLQKFFEHYNKFKKIQEKIQSDEQNFFANHNKFENMPEYNNTPITELEAATIYATNIEKGCCPILGDLLKKAFWGHLRKRKKLYAKDLRRPEPSGTEWELIRRDYELRHEVVHHLPTIFSLIRSYCLSSAFSVLLFVQVSGLPQALHEYVLPSIPVPSQQGLP